MSNETMNTLEYIGEEITKAAEFLQKKFPQMPLDVTYQLAAMARQERGQAAMKEKECELAEYNENMLRAILDQLRELNELQFTTNGVVRTISEQLHR